MIVDTETMDFEVIDNAANVNAFKGAGIQAATMISERGVEALLTGYCGPNAFTTLEAAGIKVGSDTVGTVAEAVETFKKETSGTATRPTRRTVVRHCHIQHVDGRGYRHF